MFAGAAVGDVAKLGNFAANFIFCFNTDVLERQHHAAAFRMAPTCDFLLQDMLDAFKGQKQGCIFTLCEHAHIRDELEDLVVQFEGSVFNIFAVKDIFTAKLVPHVGHEFKDAVIALKNAFEFLEQQGKGYALLVAPA